MDQSPFRESPLTDLPERVSRLESKVSQITLGWRENAWVGWRRLGYLVSTLAVCSVLWFVGTRTLFRGSAWGDDAHRNAERAALRWARSQWPSTGPESVYCTDRMPDDQLCYVNDPNHVTWAIICEDDYPHANDGCEVGRLERAEVFKPPPDGGTSADRR